MQIVAIGDVTVIVERHQAREACPSWDGECRCSEEQLTISALVDYQRASEARRRAERRPWGWVRAHWPIVSALVALGGAGLGGIWQVATDRSEVLAAVREVRTAQSTQADALRALTKRLARHERGDHATTTRDVAIVTAQLRGHEALLREAIATLRELRQDIRQLMRSP